MSFGTELRIFGILYQGYGQFAAGQFAAGQFAADNLPQDNLPQEFRRTICRGQFAAGRFAADNLPRTIRRGQFAAGQFAARQFAADNLPQYILFDKHERFGLHWLSLRLRRPLLIRKIFELKNTIPA